MDYQSAKRSSTGRRACLHPLKEGCKVVLLLHWLVYTRTSTFFPKPRDLWYMLHVREKFRELQTEFKTRVSKQEAVKYADLGNVAVKQDVFGVRVKALQCRSRWVLYTLQ